MSAFNFTLARVKALPSWHSGRCRNGGRRMCPYPATHVTTYDYPTGKRGVMVTQRKYVCEAHAAAFAKQHKLEYVARP